MGGDSCRISGCNGWLPCFCFNAPVAYFLWKSLLFVFGSWSYGWNSSSLPCESQLSTQPYGFQLQTSQKEVQNKREKKIHLS